jgi:hypothetical protein
MAEPFVGDFVELDHVPELFPENVRVLKENILLQNQRHKLVTTLTYHMIFILAFKI